VAIGSQIPPADRALTLRIDPAFDPGRLSAPERLWYDRTLVALEASRDVADEAAASGDLYTLGRTFSSYVALLLAGLRATGDRRFLDRAAEVGDLAASRLADPWLDGTRDGYRNWLWLIDDDPTYYGKDTHQMDEAMTHGGIGLLAHALHVNRDVDAVYASQADFWLHYLESDFLPKWTGRAGGELAAWEDPEAGFYKRLVHPRGNQLRLAAYLWKMTGDPFYQERAGAIAAELRDHMEVNPEIPSAFRWKHQVQGQDEGWQKSCYARYYIQVVQEMYLEEIGGFGDPALAAGFVSTYRDVVFGPCGPDYTTMGERVYGDETVAATSSGELGLARWDGTGDLLEVAEVLSDNTYPRNRIHMAPWTLLAVSRRVPEDATGLDGPAVEHPGWAAEMSPPIGWRLAGAPGPNPFRGQVEALLSVDEPASITLEVLDVQGRRLSSWPAGRLEAGNHRLVWDGRANDGSPVPSGAYFWVIRSPRGARTVEILKIR